MSTQAIHDAVITALQAIDGTGSYNNDVSGSGQVTRRSFAPTPPILPIIHASLEEVQESDGPELGDYDESMVIRVVGVVAGSDADARIQKAQGLLDDIRLALRSDRSLGGLAIDTMPVSATAFDGAEVDAAISYGIAFVMLRIRYFEDGTP